MKLTGIVAVAACAVTLIAARGIPSVVTYVPHDKVNTTMAKGGQIIGGHNAYYVARQEGITA
jgi:hypothetical protein